MPRVLFRPFLPGLTLLLAAPPVGSQADVLQVMAGAHSDFLGEFLGGLGDVDGDGRADFFASEAGLIRVVSGADGGTLHAFPGTSACAIGDLDGDGRADVVVWQPFGSSALFLRVHSGATGAVLLDVPNPPVGVGWAGALTTGDVDGDGVPDLIVGGGHFVDVYVGPWSDSAVLVYSGVDAATILTLGCGAPCKGSVTGPGSGDQFGRDVAFLGDVNLDGHGDVAVAYQAEDCTGTYHGWSCWSGTFGVRVHSGADAALLLDVPLSPDVHHASLAAAGDLTGDGVGDLAVGGGGYVGNGAWAHDGATGELLFHVPPQSTTLADGFGWMVDAAGDVDLDGHADLLLGEPKNTPGVGLQPAQFASGQTGTVLAGLAAEVVDMLVATSVACAGDVNADGRPDAVVGSPWVDYGKGLVAVISYDCDGQVRAFGGGCAGSGGFVPKLELTGCPAAGADLVLHVMGALGGAPTFLVVGLVPAAAPAQGGCTLLVGQVIAGVFLGATQGAGAGGGALAVADAFPDELPAGFELVLQGFILDPGAAGGVAASAGLSLRP
jgi:hypothetical protein